MYLIVCYDVVLNRRRAKLFKRLRTYLKPVQKSVFEGPLPAPQRQQLRRDILDCIDIRTDSVRIYALCGGCRQAVELLGTSLMVDDPDNDTLI